MRSGHVGRGLRPVPVSVNAVGLALLFSGAAAHNWINNPPSRIPGLTKESPCPARPNANSLNFVATKGVPFGLEWAIGHPNTYTYFALVKRDDEGKLGQNTEAVLNKYLAAAPPASKAFMAGKAFDKQHVRWIAKGQRAGDKSAGPMPTVGQGTDGAHYTKQLTAADPNFVKRPDNWRCGREKKFDSAAKCKAANAQVNQYEYIASDVATDDKAAYTSAAYPWLVAAAKFRHVNKRPQDYDLANFLFPEAAAGGEYVLQYLWRGYYDCFDILYSAADTGGGGGGGGAAGGGGATTGPVLVTETVWVKTDHCQYKAAAPPLGYTFANNKKYKCGVVPPNGDMSACMAMCEKQAGCVAMNVVPLLNAPLVRFPADVNIPWTKKGCKQATIEKAAAGTARALVCYGFSAPDTPEVGTAYTVATDARDAVFYSTCYRKEEITRVQGAGSGAEETKEAPWRFGDQCVACAQARANAEAGVTTAPSWTVAPECDLCSETA